MQPLEIEKITVRKRNMNENNQTFGGFSLRFGIFILLAL